MCAPEDVTSPHVLAADEYVVLQKGKSAIAPYLDIEGLTMVAKEREWIWYILVSTIDNITFQFHCLWLK